MFFTERAKICYPTFFEVYTWESPRARFIFTRFHHEKELFQPRKICEILAPFAQAQCPHLPTTFTPVATGALWPVAWIKSQLEKRNPGSSLVNGKLSAQTTKMSHKISYLDSRRVPSEGVKWHDDLVIFKMLFLLFVQRYFLSRDFH